MSHTRPNLLYLVGLISRYMETPTSDHLLAENRILRYLKVTLDFGLIYLKCQIQDVLVGYSDSVFVGNVDDRRSTSGHVFFMGSSIVSWGSMKQKIVALSSCEAEYIAATSDTCQGDWLNRLIYVKTEDQLADILTKSLGRLKLIEMREHLGIKDVRMQELEQGGD